MAHSKFSFRRLWAVVIKEMTQLTRDRTTFIMIISVPLIQIIFFGYAITTNPKHLPAAIMNHDNGPFSLTLIHAFTNTQYFDFIYAPQTEDQANQLLLKHKILFILNIPSDFSHNLVRGLSPPALLEVDGTDPVSISRAISAADNLMYQAFSLDLVGPLQSLKTKPKAARLLIQPRYNPNGITQYNVVPGLIGVILTMSLVMVAAMAITREKEQGTFEGLLVNPLLPSEIIIGKVVPFILVGYIQLLITFILGRILFDVPIQGSILLLLIAAFPFILANLSVGISISTIAKTQLQATQTGLLFFLPSLLLSGFAFPFKGMPSWAQYLGNCLPLTHFVNITRGIMLKGIPFKIIWTDLWPIILFLLITLFIAIKRFRQTLD